LLLAIQQSSLITAVRQPYSCSVPVSLANKLLLSGHYIENTSNDEPLVWLEFYKSDRVADISLAQWLALTPDETVANTLKIDIEVVKQIKEEKQLLIKGN
jgi:oxalate decarboxylase/phosphoglucose isomerase-like protein (cupin superfamily)